MCTGAVTPLLANPMEFSLFTNEDDGDIDEVNGGDDSLVTTLFNSLFVGELSLGIMRIGSGVVVVVVVAFVVGAGGGVGATVIGILASSLAAGIDLI